MGTRCRAVMLSRLQKASLSAQAMLMMRLDDAGEARYLQSCFSSRPRDTARVQRYGSERGRLSGLMLP